MKHLSSHLSFQFGVSAKQGEANLFFFQISKNSSIVFVFSFFLVWVSFLLFSFNPEGTIGIGFLLFSIFPLTHLSIDSFEET